MWWRNGEKSRNEYRGRAVYSPTYRNFFWGKKKRLPVANRFKIRRRRFISTRATDTPSRYRARYGHGTLLTSASDTRPHTPVSVTRSYNPRRGDCNYTVTRRTPPRRPGEREAAAAVNFRENYLLLSSDILPWPPRQSRRRGRPRAFARVKVPRRWRRGSAATAAIRARYDGAAAVTTAPGGVWICRINRDRIIDCRHRLIVLQVQYSTLPVKQYNDCRRHRPRDNNTVDFIMFSDTLLTIGTCV